MRELLKSEDAALLEGYFQNYLEGGDGEHFWAYMEVAELVRSNPERAWQLTVIMLHSAQDSLYRAYVAAGPLEDLLAWHGSQFIDRAESLAASQPWFLEGLSGIYVRAEEPVRGRIERLLERAT